VDKRAARAREHMANKYEKRGEIEPGDCCTIMVPKKDRPSGATVMRILVRVLRRRGHIYELQTKHAVAGVCRVKLRLPYSPIAVGKPILRRINRIEARGARTSNPGLHQVSS
jgi:hypothetical protein